MYCLLCPFVSSNVLTHSKNITFTAYAFFADGLPSAVRNLTLNASLSDTASIDRIISTSSIGTWTDLNDADTLYTLGIQVGSKFTVDFSDVIPRNLNFASAYNTITSDKAYTVSAYAGRTPNTIPSFDDENDEDEITLGELHSPLTVRVPRLEGATLRNPIILSFHSMRIKRWWKYERATNRLTLTFEVLSNPTGFRDRL